MRLLTACFARIPQRWTSRIYIHFLLMFQEVRLISKTRNQLLHKISWLQSKSLHRVRSQPLVTPQSIFPMAHQITN
jgi:hypothetical protein